MRRLTLTIAGAALAALAMTACTPDAAPVPTATVTSVATVTATATATATAAPDPNLVPNPFARPAWLGTEPLAKTSNDLAKPGKTPQELQVRQLEPGPSALADPASDEWFVTIGAVPADVLARSSWTAECPVKSTDLAYVTMPFWGFDMKPHTGEMLINAKYAKDVSTVFKYIYQHRFPIEEMRVTTAEEVSGTHYGDQNVTISFECRHTTGGYDTWSAHASGLALDINPFHNPWVRNGFVYPELATSYKDRTWLRPGMIETNKQIIAEFKKIGWSWGGNWGTFDDWMHFSANNH